MFYVVNKREKDLLSVDVEISIHLDTKHAAAKIVKN